ncbi:Beta-glucosidase 26 [Phytophthora cinnamomi]|uniref:Beta-glucosidase 26 n=1 Tax=Phytophthora cinnamomi TaxID=4785 RepID=UPI00355AA290|nr:Beta-glucosidase 26 [Phytophthora cinnamomi]
MQQSAAAAGNPATPKTAAPEGFSSSRPATPKINMAVVNATATPAAVATPPVIPKTGMSVQELKQLTALRVASQNVPVHASEVTGLVSKAVLSNAAKSHYRDSLRSSLTPGSTPKRAHHTRSSSSTQFGSAQYSGFGGQASDLSRSHGPSDLSRSLGPLNSGSSGDVIPVRGHRSRSRSSQLPNVDTSDNMPMRYSYTGGQTPEDYFSSYDFGGGNSTSSQETDPGRGSLDDGTTSSRNSLLQFPEESFPPPPPMDESGGFVSTALPSWSPPPARTKKLNASASSGATFYNQQTSYYNIASKDESSSNDAVAAGTSQAQDQNAVLAPPPGLTRRPSMTVPWQVAEAVLNTPQTNTGRKKLLDSDLENSTSGLNSSAAEAAAQLTGLSLQPSTRSRGNSGLQSPPPPLSSSGTLSSSPSSSGGMPLSGGAAGAARRGSFGNAAEFFKFRRRSKSRLELARDMSFGDGGELGGYPSYGTAGAMPGIAERHGDAEDGAHDDSASDASSSTSANDESSSQDYTDEDVVQVTGGYDDNTEISGSFVSFYNAARQQQGGLSALSIPPPPPPPPMGDDDDDASTTSSSKGNGLPMMSPNGARLRKVAELARRGSLSSEDKTRAKDEIIQSSLGIGANNAARLLATKKEDRGDRVPATAPSVTAPPGFPGIPRTTPKASGKKMLAPGSGIVRSSAAAPSSTSAGAAAAAAALGASSQKADTSGSSSLEERLAAAAQKVADCVGKGDMTGFQQAMDELDWLRNEASKLMRG